MQHETAKNTINVLLFILVIGQSDFFDCFTLRQFISFIYEREELESMVGSGVGEPFGKPRDTDSLVENFNSLGLSLIRLNCLHMYTKSVSYRICIRRNRNAL